MMSDALWFSMTTTTSGAVLVGRPDEYVVGFGEWWGLAAAAVHAVAARMSTQATFFIAKPPGGGRMSLQVSGTREV